MYTLDGRHNGISWWEIDMVINIPTLRKAKKLALKYHIDDHMFVNVWTKDKRICYFGIGNKK